MNLLEQIKKDIKDKKVKKIILDVSTFSDKELNEQIKDNEGLKLFGYPVEHNFLGEKKCEIVEDTFTSFINSRFNKVN